MRKYELAVVLDPDLETKEKDKIIEEIKKGIEKAEGKVVKLDEWGVKKLAYSIKKSGKKFTKALYFLFNLEMPAGFPAEIGTKLRLHERVLRYLLVKEE